MNADWIKPAGFHFFDLPDSTAIFIVCPPKTFVVQTESGLGERLKAAQEGRRGKRPQTCDLLYDFCAAVGAKVAGVALTEVKKGVFYSVISLSMKNELGEKFIEIDARPSDALTLAFAARAPVLVSRKMLDACEDAGAILEKLRAKYQGVDF